ncbi:MAG: DUF3990 domain-containing protein [Lachnospiraceae bacterium]|nr:DUF3990 domain-containing protein [Lachnospiraceae bacterium]GFI01650.1 hypothetical protein IMSAGC005_00473 [Lachnospiraceae bacterium]
MKRLMNDMLLYHGSYCEVNTPDLSRCAKYKDFGQGFYLTTSKEQAENFAKISVRKAIKKGTIDTDQKHGMVSVFRTRFVEKLLVQSYSAADAQWLHCVVGHRRRNTFSNIISELESYDVIAGKIANDSTNATITTYMAGAFGVIGTKSADDICIGLLLPERLQNQFCFRTNKALDSLVFEESEKIWL